MQQEAEGGQRKRGSKQAGYARPAKRSRQLLDDESSRAPTRRPRGLPSTELPRARWTRLLEDGTVAWDAGKVRCFYSDEERKDELMLRNVVHGAIVTGHMYPLIFDDEAATSPVEWARLRSMPFYESMVADGATVYDGLSEEAKRIVAVGLRDLFFASAAGLLSEHETAVFKRMIHIVESDNKDHNVDDFNRAAAAAAEDDDDDDDSSVGTRLVVEAQGMQLSFHPSARFSIVRFIEHLDEAAMGAEWAGYFARAGNAKGASDDATDRCDDSLDGDCDEAVVVVVPVLHAVFVDPAELSYHNFENIVPLDRWFEAKSHHRTATTAAAAAALMNATDGKAEEAEMVEGQYPPLDLKLSSIVKHQPTGQPARKNGLVLSARLSGRSVELLRELDGLDLYVQPLNAETRGGRRFIFHSALLSKALSTAVRESGLLSALEPVEEEEEEEEKEEQTTKRKPTKKKLKKKAMGNKATATLTSSFTFVNSVFRLNKFRPGDAKFASHRDTPYYDARRHHVSKYTMLLYLTSGRGDPWALRVDDLVRMEHIDEMTCVIFDQRLEHEGRPYVAGNDKLFLRTELIFEDHYLEHDPSVAALFSKACYMTGQGVLQPDLNAWAHAYYERVNALHWRLEAKPSQGSRPGQDSLLLYKRTSTSSHHFMTNGYDYWFPHRPDEDGSKVNDDDDDDDDLRRRHVQLKEFAMLAVLDYFNGKLQQQQQQHNHAFRELLETVALCRPEEIKAPADIDDWVWAYMQDHNASRPNKEEVEVELAKAGKKKTKKPRLVSYDRETVKNTIYDIIAPSENLKHGRHCCPFHRPIGEFTTTKCPDVISCYVECCNYAATKLLNAPVWLFNTRVIINESNILIDNDKIYIMQGPGEKDIPPINFAACWNNPESPPDYIGVKGSHYAPKLLIPPIIYRTYPQGYRLVCDFFRNDWMIHVDIDRQVPVPTICDEGLESEAPYFRAINPELSHCRSIHDLDSDGEYVDPEIQFFEWEFLADSSDSSESGEDEDD